jgi:hypothetical protein
VISVNEGIVDVTEAGDEEMTGAGPPTSAEECIEGVELLRTGMLCLGQMTCRLPRRSEIGLNLSGV